MKKTIALLTFAIASLFAEVNREQTLVISDEGKVIYSHSGKWKKDEIKQIDSIIRSEVK